MGVIVSVTFLKRQVPGLSSKTFISLSKLCGIVAVIYPVSELLSKTGTFLLQLCGIIAVIHVGS